MLRRTPSRTWTTACSFQASPIEDFQFAGSKGKQPFSFDIVALGGIAPIEKCRAFVTITEITSCMSLLFEPDI